MIRSASERGSPPDSIAYPPRILFTPTLEGYCNLFSTRTRQTPDYIASLGAPRGTCDEVTRGLQHETRARPLGHRARLERAREARGLDEQQRTITIERMDRFDASLGAATFEWAERLPYPWCPTEQAIGPPAPLDALVREAARVVGSRELPRAHRENDR